MKHLKLFFALFAMLALGVGNAWAETTISFGFSNWDGVTANFSGTAKDEVTQTVDGIKVTYTRNGSNLYANTSAIRFYKSNTLKFDAPTGYSIQSISFSCTSYQTDITSNVGTCTATSSNLSWSGDATSVTFTRPSSASSYATITGATVTLAATSGGSTPDPGTGEGGEDPETPGTGGSGTIVIKYNSTFAPALPTASGSVNTTATAHTAEGLSFKEIGIYKVSSSNYLMFTQNKGFLYNTQSLGTITSVSVTYSSGTSTSGKAGVYFGATEQSTYTTTSNTTIKGTSKTDTWINTTEGNGFFQLSTSNKNVQITQIEITYTSGSEGGGSGETVVKTLQSIAVAGMTTSYQVGDDFSFDGTCTATYSVTKDGVAQPDVVTETVTPTSVSTPDMTQVGTPTVTVTYTEGEVTKTAEYAITIEEAPTYDFRKIEGFDDWESSYMEHIVEYADAKVTFASANKNGSTITDQPVTKGGDVSLVLTDGMNIATVKWVCTQWGTKAQTITLHYSKDGGVTYTSTGITSQNFTISSDNLPTGTNAVKITFSSTSNQVGIKSCTITKVEAAAITQVPAPQFSLQGGAYDGAQSVELTCTMADATIYYTTDGNDPTTSSSVYSTAIQVTESMTIKAYAVKEGLEDSPVVEATYEISAPADVVLDFTTNNWELPSGSANKVTTEASYTDGTYTVSVAGTNGHYFDTNNLITGKKDAYIVLPIFNKPIVKIVCEGVDAGSGSVIFNVFVDDEAVSTAVTSCKVDQTFLIAEDKQVANVAHVIKVTSDHNLRVSKIKIYLGEAPAVERPIIAGEEEFAGSTEVTITCPTSGATIYYTTNGDAPTNTSTPYSDPFSIYATTTVKAIAYDANGNASKVVEMTFTKHDLVNVATAMALEKDKVAYFDEFEVVKVVKGKGYIYIKDNSGHGLIFDYDLDEVLNDGDRVKGFVGISSPYNTLPEHKVHNITASDLTITPGTPAEPYDFTNTAIAADHLNKYVVFKGVEMTADVDVSTHPTLTIGGNSANFRNQLSMSKILESGKKYDIYAFVARYNTTLQYYFYQALEEGEECKTYTITYNAGGATGTVPVDNSQYIEGAQVFLQSALSLSYEGYNYKGWKVTDEAGNVITVTENKFNMPASNVTATAQWEQIKERLDFSTGLWVLVTDASELVEGDKIIFTAAEANVAMMSYESGNNIKKCDVAKFGKDNCFLTWKSEIGVYQLVASGDKYAIQDVNTEQYIYAAGTGSSNYLKATDEVPATGMEPYRWNITIDENGTTVQATSENRNLLAYNKTNAIFSCYAASSNQQPIAIYKYVSDPAKYYTRDVVTGNLGTICLPYASSKHAGATFYEIAYLEMNGTDPNRIYLDEVEGGVLEAGKPYIFQAKSNKVTVAYEGEASSLKEGVKGLVGILEDSKVVNGQEGVSNILTGNYVISGTKFYTCGTGCSIYKNRAYIDASIIANHTTPVAEMPGRRRIAMGAAGENQATGVDNTLAPKDNVVKVIENGQLIIIRDGVKYNVQGQKL